MHAAVPTGSVKPLVFEDEVAVQLVHRAGEAADDLEQRRHATLFNLLCINHCPMQVEQGTLWHKHLTETAVTAARSTTVIGQTCMLLQGTLRSALAPQRTAKEAALISTFLGITAAVAKTGSPFVVCVVTIGLSLHTLSPACLKRFLYPKHTPILFTVNSCAAFQALLAARADCAGWSLQIPRCQRVDVRRATHHSFHGTTS